MLNKNIKLNELSKENVIALNYDASSNKSKVKLSIPAEKKSSHTIYSSIITSRAPTEMIYYIKKIPILILFHNWFFLASDVISS